MTLAAICAMLIWTGCGRRSPEVASSTPSSKPSAAATEVDPESSQPAEPSQPAESANTDPPGQATPAPGPTTPDDIAADTTQPDLVSGEASGQEASGEEASGKEASGAETDPNDDSASGEEVAEVDDEPVFDSPAFRMLLPTTAGPLVVDVDCRIGDAPIESTFDARVDAVMSEASGSSDLTWRKLFDHVASDREQFGRASQINANQYRNMIRLYDRNRNKKPDQEEVVRFLFRNAKYAGPFWLIGSDFFREINRTQSAVFSALDRNQNRILDPDEIDRADESIYRLDRNGDRRIDLSEVSQLSEDDKTVWKNQRSGRWGQVAMALSGYIDWQMLSYNLDEATRGGVFGETSNVIAKLDQDGDDSIDAAEAKLLSSIRPDARLLVKYPRHSSDQPTIEIVFVSREIEPHVRRTQSLGQVGIVGDALRLIARVTDRRIGRNQIPPEAFAALDANDDGGLEESEIPEQALQQYSFEDLDEDEDGKLTLREINEGMSPKSPIWNVQIRARGAESPDAVFAWLDQNQDFVLSTREVIGLVGQLRKVASADGSVRPEDIPDSFVIQFGRGDPDQDEQLFAMTTATTIQGAADVNKSWPRWAQSMDTNRDGDISREEFPGTNSQFTKLDTNSDAFIDGDEILAQ